MQRNHVEADSHTAGGDLENVVLLVFGEGQRKMTIGMVCGQTILNQLEQILKDCVIGSDDHIRDVVHLVSQQENHHRHPGSNGIPTVKGDNIQSRFVPTSGVTRRFNSIASRLIVQRVWNQEIIFVSPETGRVTVLQDTAAAVTYFSHYWKSAETPEFFAAARACYAVLDGYGDPENARIAVLAALNSVGITPGPAGQ